MNRDNIKIGMYLRVSDDLSLTEQTWTTVEMMLKMKGGVYKVYDFRGHNGVEMETKEGYVYTFCPQDLHPATPKAPPLFIQQTFDVNLLDI